MTTIKHVFRVNLNEEEKRMVDELRNHFSPDLVGSMIRGFIRDLYFITFGKLSDSKEESNADH